MLIKKDFIKIAEILNKGIINVRVGMYENSEEYQTAMNDFNFMIDEFTKWFKSEFPKFDEDKFKEAVFKE